MNFARLRLAARLATLFALLAAAPLAADEVPPAPPADLDALSGLLDELLGELDPAAIGLPAAVGSEREELLGLMALEAGRYVWAREVAERTLAGDPDSYAAHCLLGAVQQSAEGNLPRAAYHFRRCHELFDARHGEIDEADPWFWHQFALQHLYQVHHVLGEQEQALGYVDLLEKSYQGDFRSLRGWPLVELRRFAEARAAIEAVVRDSEDPDARSHVLMALCYLEGELGALEASYDACKLALELRRERNPVAVLFTNLAEAARGLLRMEEAEALLLEATEHLHPYSLSQPWMDLLNLYLDQARIPEALGAMRQMLAWRAQTPPEIDVQNRSFRDLSSAELLLVAGRPVEAGRLTGRALDETDRLGQNSVDPQQMQAGAVFLDRAVHRAAAELRREEASWSELRPALRLHLEALRFELRAWRSGRRLVALLSDERLLASRLAPRPPGLMRFAEWLEPDLVELLGPAVVEAALSRTEGRGVGPGERGYRLAFAAESAALRSRDREALELADRALAELPPWERLLRARVAARAAEAALALGESRRGAELLDLVFQLDPGVVRRLGLAIPCRFEPPQGPVAREAWELLRDSPRLRPSDRGFRLIAAERDGEAEACLLGLNDVRLACARVSPRAGELGDALARRLAREFHAVAFAPRIDLTQADLKSLDGSTVVAGGGAGDRARLVLQDPVAD